MRYLALFLLVSCGSALAKNPTFPGSYGDPGSAVLDNKYWIFPTTAAPDKEQTYFDAFSSSDMINWKKHPRVLEEKDVNWADSAFRSPSPFQHNGKYYLAFSAHSSFLGQGIGIAVADNPEGPYRDLLHHPVIGGKNGNGGWFPNVFIGNDSQIYMLYDFNYKGNLVKLIMNHLKSIVPFEDGSNIKDVTPEGWCVSYVLFERNGVIYLLCNKDPVIEYSTSKSVVGPFSKGRAIMNGEYKGFKVRAQSVIKAINQDRYFLVYQRAPQDVNKRVICVEDMKFDGNGDISEIWPTEGGAFNDRPTDNQRGSAFSAVIDLKLVYVVAAMQFAALQF